jgi:GNAT superfamily N-acetyltransferase
MDGYVYVRRPWRRRGIGWRLLRAVLEEALADGRSALVWSTYDSLAGGRRSRGASVAGSAG